MRLSRRPELRQIGAGWAIQKLDQKSETFSTCATVAMFVLMLIAMTIAVTRFRRTPTKAVSAHVRFGS
jgi:hypothetical protein